MSYIVKIVDDETGDTIISVDCKTKRRADKIADGVSINLNHDRFTVHVEPKPFTTKRIEG